MKKMMRSLSFIFGILLLAVVLVGVSHFFERPDQTFESVDSRSNFMKIISDYKRSQQHFGFYASKSADTERTAGDSLESADYSETNTQVNGIDEADQIKTDGKYIYQISQNRLLVTTAYPLDDAGKTEEIHYDDGFYPRSLYVDDHYVVVIGFYYSQKNDDKSKTENKSMIYYPYNSTMVYVYEKGEYQERKHEFLFDGSEVTTRKNGDTLVLIVQKYLPIYQDEIADHEILPRYQINGIETTVDYDEVYYQNRVEPSQMATIFKINLNTSAVEHFSYLGAANTVYMNDTSVYLANPLYTFRILPAIFSNNSSQDDGKTIITKVNYQDQLERVGSVSVKGYIRDQFMMDEYKGNFRITTTYGSTWDESSENNVYIYDSSLKLLGSVEGLAKGEAIQSTRFVGDRIYMVTFRQIDPFFVIDASDPKNPKVLGELKIPGFSTYLHPYDENHVIGLGFEADLEGRTTGIKMALYEVSNPNEPIEKFKEVMLYEEMGYSYSEVTYNHKALLFSKDKGIIGFPFTSSSYVTKEVKENGRTQTIHHYVQKQEYKVFSIDLDEGFQLQANITHHELDKFSEYNSHYRIDRGLYIGNYLYTVSNAKIEIHDLTTFERVMRIDLPFDESKYPGWHYGW